MKTSTIIILICTILCLSAAGFSYYYWKQNSIIAEKYAVSTESADAYFDEIAEYGDELDTTSLPNPQIEEFKGFLDNEVEKLHLACDIENDITRGFAVSLAKRFPGNLNIGQICNIYSYLYKNWKYVNDPNGKEYLASASKSIELGLAGDCDDFAVLMASLIEAIGGTSRITYGFNGNEGHAWAEVKISDNFYPHELANELARLYNDRLEINYKFGNGGYWLNLDWSSKYPGGPYYDYENAIIFDPFNKTYSVDNRKEESPATEAPLNADSLMNATEEYQDSPSNADSLMNASEEN